VHLAWAGHGYGEPAAEGSASLFAADRMGETMLRIVKLGIFCAVLVTALVFAPLLNARQPNETAAAPVPAQVITGKKVFISNAGYDSIALAVFKREGEPDKPYNQFYAAMKSWGRYELVDSPSEADLVFEIRFNSNFFAGGIPELDLAILDVKTHFSLWSITAPVEGAIRKVTWKKNFSQGITNLMDDLKKLTTQAVAAADSPNK
jgi:hypothetical protein